MSLTTVTSSLARLACDLGAGAPGADARPAVLLLHAGVADMRCWQGLVATLAGTHRPIAFDRRGFGATTCEPERFSHVTDALAVLDAAGADRAVVVGHSMGGRVAVDLALAHPERVSGLVLIAASVRGASYDRSPPEVEALEEAAEAAETAGDLDTTNRLEAHLWLDGPEQPEGRVGGLARELFLEMNRNALALADPGPGVEIEAEEAAAGGLSAWDRLVEITVPALVAVGELDYPSRRTVAEQTAARLPAGRFVTLPAVAHLPQLEGSEHLTGEVLALLRAVDGG